MTFQPIVNNGCNHAYESVNQILNEYFQLEETVAEFIGAEAAITVGMGFATNSLNLPSLINKVLTSSNLFYRKILIALLMRHNFFIHKTVQS